MLKPEQCPLVIYRLGDHTLWLDPAGDEDGNVVWWTLGGETVHRGVNYMSGYVDAEDKQRVFDLSEAALRIALYNLDWAGELGDLAGRLRGWADTADSVSRCRSRA